jgi:hypothetical protein
MDGLKGEELDHDLGSLSDGFALYRTRPSIQLQLEYRVPLTFVRHFDDATCKIPRTGDFNDRASGYETHHSNLLRFAGRKEADRKKRRVHVIPLPFDERQRRQVKRRLVNLVASIKKEWRG